MTIATPPKTRREVAVMRHRPDHKANHSLGPQRLPHRNNQKGYILLAVMLLITLMMIALSVELPRIAQQVKREKEEELVHRGMDYARAVKRFYHKSNQYPSSIEQLKDTNHIRFLRKEYKDPMTGESEWKLVHVNEAEIKIPAGNGAQGLQGANPGLTGGTGTPGQPQGSAAVNPGGAASTGSSGFSGGSTGLSGGSTGLSGGSSGLSGGSTGLSGGSTGLSGGSTGLTGSTTGPGQGSGSAQTGGVAAPGGSGALQTSGIGLNNPVGQTFGGGQIIGVASTSKKTSIKEFNDKSEYDQWYFVYDPRLEQQGPNQIGSANGGLMIAAPRGGPAGQGQGQGTPTGLQGSQSPQSNGTNTPQVPR
jgi:type II secretory pathway pseudopilin PulG